MWVHALALYTAALLLDLHIYDASPMTPRLQVSVTPVYTHTRAHKHTHTHTHTHTRTHTHTNISVRHAQDKSLLEFTYGVMNK